MSSALAAISDEELLELLDEIAAEDRAHAQERARPSLDAAELTRTLETEWREATTRFVHARELTPGRMRSLRFGDAPQVVTDDDRSRSLFARNLSASALALMKKRVTQGGRFDAGNYPDDD